MSTTFSTFTFGINLTTLIVACSCAITVLALAMYFIKFREKREVKSIAKSSESVKVFESIEALNKSGKSISVEKHEVNIQEVLNRNFELLKEIRNMLSALESLIKFTTSEAIDVVTSRLEDLKREIQSIRSLITYPPFVQVGYVPQTLSEICSMFKLNAIQIRDSSRAIIDQYGIDEDLEKVIDVMFDLIDKITLSQATFNLGNKYISVIKINKVILFVSSNQYLDVISLSLLRDIVKKYLENVKGIEFF